MAFDWPAIFGGLLVLAPAGLVLVASYGRFDGLFRDNVVFLNLMGGMALGAVAGAFLLFLAGSELGFLFGFALLPPLSVLAVANRRKWQGVPHAVFNAGALGTGAGVMTALVLARDRLRADAPGAALELLAFACAVTLLGAAVGWGLGVGVLRRRPFRAAALAAVASAPMGFLAYEFLVGRARVWLVAAVLLAVAAYVWADRVLLPFGLGEEERRRRSRLARARTRAP